MIRLIFAAMAIALASPALAQVGPSIYNVSTGLVQFLPLPDEIDTISTYSCFKDGPCHLGWSQVIVAQIPPAPPPPPTDQEIAARHKVCNQVDHMVPIGAIRNGPDGKDKRPEGAGGYLPEYKALCEVIDAEHARRDLAAKAKKAKEIEELNSIIGRISK